MFLYELILFNPHNRFGRNIVEKKFLFDFSNFFLKDTSMNNIDNAADNTQNMINDFDFSSNSGFFNHNGAEICNGFHPDQYSNENVNSNFNV